jgi:putative transposase
MSRRRSPIVGTRYPLRTVYEVWRVPSSVYALETTPASDPTTAKRGPKTAQSDGEIVALIREILATSPLHSEAHLKVRVRLGSGALHGKARALRLMRAHGLLAPTRPGHVHGDPAHTGRD